MGSLPRFLYAAIRRLQILDVKRLLHLPKLQDDELDYPDGYEIRSVGAEDLTELLRTGQAPQNIGDAKLLDDSDRALVVATHDDRVVSFIWLARHKICGDYNFSRCVHLGTSLEFPEATSFVFNVWTDPQHRGKRLIAAMIVWAMAKGVLGTVSLLTMIDCTNTRSIRAFEHVGMRPLGSVYRLGRGQFQLSLSPKGAESLGLRLAADTPGWKFAC